MFAVDANMLVRLLTGDDAKQGSRHLPLGTFDTTLAKLNSWQRN